MEPIIADILVGFLEKLGASVDTQTEIYLLGVSVLCLMGSPRATMDIDYTTDLGPGNQEAGLPRFPDVSFFLQG